MEKLHYHFVLLMLVTLLGQNSLSAQQLSGRIIQEDDSGIEFANVVLYNHSDSSLVKVETTNENGEFSFKALEPATYYIESSFIGLSDFSSDRIVFADSDIQLGDLRMLASSIELDTAVVTARRSLVEIKPDRTIFNVEGTINSAGDNGLGLLRKAPGVLVDNNNNVSVLGRAGVLFYVDGKRLPLSGDDLVAYLRNLTAEQIDKIDIITNPGAKYEAEGNAGIIDIRLKRDKSLGLNGSASLNASQGYVWRSSASTALNYRNKKFNTFATLGYNYSKHQEWMFFDSYQNGFRLWSETKWIGLNTGPNYRFGTDFFVGENHTVGFLLNGGFPNTEYDVSNKNIISGFGTVREYDTTPEDVVIPESEIDSIMNSLQLGSMDRTQNTYNVNYTYNKGETRINIDGDYGAFRTEQSYEQPNTFLSRNEDAVLGNRDYFFETPIEIDIKSFRVDYENSIGSGKIGTGVKVSNVSTENRFLFYDVIGNERTRDDLKSNEFFYDETVYAGYLSYNSKLTDKWNLSSGLRAESTSTTSDLDAFVASLDRDPRDSSYFSLFPNVGLTYQASRTQMWSFSYGRRINRPDYNVLNPFRSQFSELDFSIGNPALRPEIVNNFEVGYTLNYMYNFKLAYSKTTDQITRLIGADDSDPRASFINWDNLAEQHIYSFNASIPHQFSEKWNAFFNISTNYLKNEAVYPDGNIIDLDAFSYNVFQQHTFTLPNGFVGELSGWYSGPGIWGGVFEYESSWSLNLGLQKKFFQERLNVKIAAQDIFRQAYWSGTSDFDNLFSFGQGNWDSRRGSISISYNFGNNQVKTARKRETSIETESSRVGENTN